MSAHLSRSLTCDNAREGDRWYQNTVAFLVHPRNRGPVSSSPAPVHSPITHLLVAHQLGTGKTISMLRILDNYFDDRRPRLLLFPTETVATNFYRELATMPNRYRDWLRAQPGMPPWPEIKGADLDVTPDDMIRLEDERQAYVVQARKRLGTWPDNVGRSVGTGLRGPLRTFSYAQGGFAQDVTGTPDGAHRASCANDRQQDARAGPTHPLAQTRCSRGTHHGSTIP